MAAVTTLLACTSDGDAGLGSGSLPGVTAPAESSPEPPAPEQPAPETPAPVQPAPETPAPEQPAPEAPAPETGADDDALTTEEWVFLILIIIAVVAVVIGVVGAATNHSERKKRDRADLNRELDHVDGTGRWIVDQGSMSVLQADAGQVGGTWSSVRAQLMGVEAQISRLAVGTGDSGLDDTIADLNRGAAGLRSALEGYVSAVSSNQVDLVDSARQTVLVRRQQFDTALQATAIARPAR